MGKKIPIAVSITILIVATLVVIGFRYFNASKDLVVDFASCAQAGYPVMESYPRQCRTPDGRSFVEQIQIDKSDLIVVDTPRPGDTVTSPLVVKGRARGNWFFEASFPVEVRDNKGTLLGQAPAQAKGEWMTIEFVPFELELPLDLAKAKTNSATLTLKKDNPSGLSEFDDQIEIPLNIMAGSSSVDKTGMCRPSGCSGQVCSDEDIVTSCIYLPEFACYRDAVCERQVSGECGWTQTAALFQCISGARKGTINENVPVQ